MTGHRSAPFRFLRLSPPDNIARPGMFTPGIIAAALLALSLVPATAPADTPADSTELQAPLIDRAHARAAHRLVENWLAQGLVDPDDAQPTPVTAAYAVHITIWRDGIHLASAQARRGDPQAALADDPGQPVDLASLVVPAARDVVAQIERRIRDAHREADESRHVPTVADISPLLLVEIQIAHSLEPIRIEPDAPASAIYDHFAPGYHGLRITRANHRADDNDADAAIVWPATALARNVQPRSQLTRALADLELPIDAIADLARPGGPAVQRFRIHHVVRPNPQMAPNDLVRGQTILPPYAADGRTIEQLAQRLGNHLHNRFTRQGMIRSTYLPTSDRHVDPLVAEPDDAALAAYALLTHTRLVARQEPGAALLIDDRIDDATRVVHLLGEEILQDDDAVAARPAAAALALLCLVDLPQRTDRDRTLRDRLAASLLELAGDRDDPPDPATDPATAAIILAALAGQWEQTREPDLAAHVARSLAALHDQLTRSVDLDALPWLVLAHNRAAHLLADTTDLLDEQTLAQREDELGRLGSRLIDLQIVASPSLGPDDVVGGFDLTGRGRHAPPAADWRSAQVLFFLAAAMRQPGITAGHDPMGWMLTTGLAARFLAQLTFTETNSYYLRNPRAASAGLRAAPWDNSLTVEAQAIALLAVTELNHALADLQEQDR